MHFDLSKESEILEAAEWLENAMTKGWLIEMKKHSTKRTLSQNAYLHVLLGIFALETGNPVDYVKHQIFKMTVNRDLFGIADPEFRNGQIFIRSSASLSKDEMILSIDRFRNFAAIELGIYLPRANETEELMKAERQLKKQKEWIT